MVVSVVSCSIPFTAEARWSLTGVNGMPTGRGVHRVSTVRQVLEGAHTDRRGTKVAAPAGTTVEGRAICNQCSCPGLGYIYLAPTLRGAAPHVPAGMLERPSSIHGKFVANLPGRLLVCAATPQHGAAALLQVWW